MQTDSTEDKKEEFCGTDLSSHFASIISKPLMMQ